MFGELRVLFGELRVLLGESRALFGESHFQSVPHQMTGAEREKGGGEEGGKRANALCRQMPTCAIKMFGAGSETRLPKACKMGGDMGKVGGWSGTHLPNAYMTSEM